MEIFNQRIHCSIQFLKVVFITRKSVLNTNILYFLRLFHIKKKKQLILLKNFKNCSFKICLKTAKILKGDQ